MSRLNRDIFIRKTIKLLEEQGYHGTRMSDILAACGAQKGSLYHFFPEGKEELAVEAIMCQSEQICDYIRGKLAQHDDVAEAVYHFLEDMSYWAEANDFRMGAPFAAIAQESANTNERLREACLHAYQQMQAVFQAKFASAGFPTEPAQELAVTITSAIDGAILLARTMQNGEPLRQLARSMRCLISSRHKS